MLLESFRQVGDVDSGLHGREPHTLAATEERDRSTGGDHRLGRDAIPQMGGASDHVAFDHVTSAPRRAAWVAAATPAGPAPMTTNRTIAISAKASDPKAGAGNPHVFDVTELLSSGTTGRSCATTIRRRDCTCWDPLFDHRVLVLAGVAKVTRPTATATALREISIPSPVHAARLLGAFEVVVGVSAILVGSPVLWALVAALYASFTVFVLWALQAESPIGSCGCFGQEDTPPTPGHAAFNAAAAAVSALAISSPVRLERLRRHGT